MKEGKVLRLKEPQSVTIEFSNLVVNHPEVEHKSKTLTITISYRSNISYSVGEFRKYLLKHLNLHQEILAERCLDWWRERVNPSFLKVTITGKYKTDPPSTITTEVQFIEED